MLATKALPEMETEKEQIAAEHQASMGTMSVSDQMQELEVCDLILLCNNIYLCCAEVPVQTKVSAE